MTGLDPTKDRILEVAAIATDWNFKEIATYEAAVKISPELAKKRMIGEFWEKHSAVKDALLRQSCEEGISSQAVEDGLLTFVTDNFNNKRPIYLAGNSIHQDRRFIINEWSRLDQKLHYRMLDVSAWKVVFENKFRKKFTKPDTHRALDDIRGSIEELKHYLGSIK